MSGKGKGKQKQYANIEIPIPALSTNKLFLGRKRRSYYYKNFRNQVLKYLDEHYDKEEYNLKGYLNLYMTVGFSSTLSDLSNSIKGIEDVLVSWFGPPFDDRYFASIHLEKRLVNKGSEFMSIKITRSRKDIDMRVKYRKSSKKKGKGKGAT